MRITVIGAGPVGSTLARSWLDAGHDVTVVVREPEHERYAALRSRTSVVTPDAGLGVGPTADAILLAVPGTALPDLIHKHGAELDGGLVLDATNRMGRVTFHQLPLFESFLPAVRLFRAFCSYGWEVFADPVIDGTAVDLPFCGPAGDAADLGTVETLISDVGMTPLRIGGLDAADTLDGVLRLWYSLAVERGMGRRLAFSTVTG